jgi:hypothetical protein
MTRAFAMKTGNDNREKEIRNRIARRVFQFQLPESVAKLTAECSPSSRATATRHSKSCRLRWSICWIALNPRAGLNVRAPTRGTDQNIPGRLKNSHGSLLACKASQPHHYRDRTAGGSMARGAALQQRPARTLSQRMVRNPFHASGDRDAVLYQNAACPLAGRQMALSSAPDRAVDSPPNST